MTLLCPQCQARLQLDNTKTPSQPFTVRCPKCQTAVKFQPADSANEATSAEAAPTSSLHLERSLAPRFALECGVPESSPVSTGSAVDFSDVAKLLADALGKANGLASGNRIRRTHPRKVLVCA